MFFVRQTIIQSISNWFYTLLCHSQGSTLTAPPGQWIASSCGEKTCSSHLYWTRSANTQTIKQNIPEYIHIYIYTAWTCFHPSNTCAHSKCTCMCCIISRQRNYLTVCSTSRNIHAAHREMCLADDADEMISYSHTHIHTAINTHTLTSTGKTWHGIFFVALPSSHPSFFSLSYPPSFLSALMRALTSLLAD